MWFGRNFNRGSAIKNAREPAHDDIRRITRNGVEMVPGKAQRDLDDGTDVIRVDIGDP